MKKRIVLIIFVAVQIIGLACSWFWHHPYSSASSLLWGVGFFVLLPGNVLGSWLVEKLFWERHLSPLATDLFTVVAVVAVNAIIWLAATKATRAIYRRSYIHDGGPDK
jgi:hypothetical protein